MSDNIVDINLEEMAALKAKVAGARSGASGLAERRADEAKAQWAQRATDGRVRPVAMDKKGRIQLNVSVSPQLKNRVIEEARATGGDMSGVVQAALMAFFKGR